MATQSVVMFEPSIMSSLPSIRFSAATQWPVFKDNAYRKFITFAVDNARESKAKCVYKAKRNDTRLKAPAELPFSPTPTPPSAAKEYPPSSFSSETPTQGRLIPKGAGTTVLKIICLSFLISANVLDGKM